MTQASSPNTSGNATAALSCAEKLALAAGSLSSLALMPGAAQAGVIQVTGQPVSLSTSAAFGSIVNWDVDADGSTDFYLRLFGATTAFPGGQVRSAGLVLGSQGANGRGLVVNTGNPNKVQPLLASFSVGPTMTNFVWGAASQPYRVAMNSYRTNSSPPAIAIGDHFDLFSPGESFFGFRFLSGGDMLYGVGVIDFDLNTGTVTIDRWAYNDTAAGSVHVQDSYATDIPEPSTASLALLGLGAGGLRAWRKRRQAQQTLAA